MNNPKKYSISVAEPWDFESRDGKNIIKGTIFSTINSMCLVFKADYLLNFGDDIGDTLVLSPRTVNSNFENIEELDVNGGLLLVDYEIGSIESELKDNCKFVLIGSIRSEM